MNLWLPVRAAFPVSYQKESSARLRHPVFRCIQRVLGEMVVQLLKARLQFLVTRPGSHVHDVLQHQPARTKEPGISDHLHGRSAARLVTRSRALRAGVIAALRRSEQQIDRSDPLLEIVHLEVLQATGHDVRRREVGRERSRRCGAHVDAGDYLHAGSPGAGTTPTGSAEDVDSPDPFRFHHRYHRYRRRGGNASVGRLLPNRRVSHIPRLPGPASRGCEVHGRCGDHGRRSGETSPSRSESCSGGYMRTGSRRAGAKNSRARIRQPDTAEKPDRAGPAGPSGTSETGTPIGVRCGAPPPPEPYRGLNAGHDLTAPFRRYNIHELPVCLLRRPGVFHRSPQWPHLMAIRRYATFSLRSIPIRLRPADPVDTRGPAPYADEAGC